MRLRPLAALLLALPLAAGCPPAAPPPPAPVVSSAPSSGDWHKRVVFYELWVRSFQDSNGDGIGDLEGLIQRLDYLAGLGVGAIWLMPTFPSPLKDSGYDVADYHGVHPDYGTLEQMQRLLDEAHRRNLKVMLDLVVNHTSLEHGWFKESRASRTGEKADWYVWSDAPGGTCNESNVVFGNERWTLDPVRGQYYFHQFFAAQPDLNFRSPGLQAAVLEVMRYWLELGVDGYRLDVPHQYVESWPDCWHQPETFAFHRRMRQALDEHPGKAMIGEVCCEPETAMPYLGNGQDALNLVFYFPGMHALWEAGKTGDATLLRQRLSFALSHTPSGGLHANTLGNHDIFRLPTTVGENAATLKLVATAQLTLPGAPFVYYGEELGMPDGAGVLVDQRDYARTPMQWDSTPNGGFTTGTPFLAPTAARRVNVTEETGRDGSMLSHYRKLIALRNQTPALHEGSFEELPAAGPSLYGYWRRHEDGDRLVVLHFRATSETAISVALPAGWAGESGLLDEVSGQQVGSVSAGTWSATVPPRTGWVLRPAP
ncbi:MAG: alpha-amylase family glycosyl hydrolase [Myxococcaceae bacterium]